MFDYIKKKKKKRLRLKLFSSKLPGSYSFFSHFLPFKLPNCLLEYLIFLWIFMLISYETLKETWTLLLYFNTYVCDAIH